MYKNVYDNAKTLADQIQAGGLKPRSKPQSSGLMKRAMENSDAPRDDMLTTLSRYLVNINAGPKVEDFSTTEAMTQAMRPVARPGSSEREPLSGNFADALMRSESGGRSDIQITAESSGREQTMTGLFQFSEDRLNDYKKSTGKDFTVEEFRSDPELQKEAFNWHISDIDRVIDANNFVVQGYSRNGLRAVAHLGGKTGMIRYAASGGEYNPSDKFGTALSDYYQDFSRIE